MISQVLDHLKSNHKTYFETISSPEINIIETIEHPNSQSVRLRINGSGDVKIIYLKILYPDELDGRSNRSDRAYKENQIQTEYDILKKLYLKFAPYENLGVVKPIACFPDDLILITEEQTGIKFASLISNIKIYSTKQQIKEVVHFAYLCGEWLRLFQDFTETADKSVYDFREINEYCRVRIDILSKYHPTIFSKKVCDEIQNFIIDKTKSLSDSDLKYSGRHNDYNSDNMIISGEKFVLLDFTGFSYGPIYSDFVKFWSGIDKMKGIFYVSKTAVKKLERSFIEGYGREIDTNHDLFTVLRIAYMLDKMGDIWLDWPNISRMRRPFYKKIYQRYLIWLKDKCALNITI